ncbi:MAG: adenylyl-sulfate kinase [Bacteroidales bacterium]|nr:adenylyl-sulfate kinase [Bacteroidales bacterium]
MNSFRRSKTERYSNPYKWTDFNSFIRRNRRRFLIRQKPKVIWFTGLSGSGKSTLAQNLNQKILDKGYFTKIFDEETIRLGLCSDLGNKPEDYKEIVRRTAEVAKMFYDSGVIVLCSVMAPTNELRNIAKNIIGESSFTEIFVNCPLEVCELRDVKGIYKKYRLGLTNNVSGLDIPFENPDGNYIEVRSDLWDVDRCTQYLLRNIFRTIKFKTKKRAKK